MIAFIAGRIMLDAVKSLSQGQEKYNAYFVNTIIYHKYKDNVDTILCTEGFIEVITDK